MKKTGTIESLNVSPKGFYEGFLLRTAKNLIQINLPKGGPSTQATGLSSGEQLAVEVESEAPQGEPAHPVFRLVRILGAHALGADGSDTQGSHRFSGSVVTLNYALHGEVNGGILDSGDFLHLKPEGARAVDLKVGMKVEGLGMTKPMVGGHSVIEADDVNGTVIHRKKKHAGH
jgi:hypothetical protein